MRTGRVVAALCIAALMAGLGIVGMPQSASAWGSNSQFQIWVVKQPQVVNTNDGRQLCAVAARIGVREFGKQGVTRFKVKWELRSEHDVNGHLPFARSSGYLHSARFANDSASRYLYSTVPTTQMLYNAGKSYHLWVKAVGDRSWRKDFTRHIDLGPVGCAVEYNEDTGNGSPGDYMSALGL
jgi:hypothetical protein